MPGAWCCRMMRPSIATSRRRRGVLGRRRTGTWPPSRNGSCRCFEPGEPRTIDLEQMLVRNPRRLLGAAAVRAALLVEPGRIVVDDVPDPTPGPDEVRIAVVGVGLCGSDLSVFRGAWDCPELSVDHGSRSVRHHRRGRSGSALDEARRDWSSSSRTSSAARASHVDGDGRQRARNAGRSGMNRPGAIAEQVVVPTQHAWRVTTGSAEDLVCVEPMTVVETALRRLRAPVPASVLVVGVGAQGSLMCLALRRRGAEVVVADVNPERTAFAVGLGAVALDRRG